MPASNPQLDASLNGLNADAPERARLAEEFGFDGVWNPEMDYDTFTAMPVAAHVTEEIEFGTRIALAFTRSPMNLAYTAWDLAQFSGGRFVLGIGTQVKAHNERRFSVEWSEPTRKLREVVEILQHTWGYWQREVEDFGYEGRHYSVSLMTEAFDPGPIDHPDVPVYLAAVNEGNVRLVGELADGICLHSFNTPKYTREKIIPWLEDSAEEHGRSLDDVTVSASPFVITGEDEADTRARREEVRARVAFYASTPSYKPVMQTHGWEDTGRELWKLSREGEWAEMATLVTDEMLSEFAVEAPPDEVAGAVKDEYGDVADRVVFDAGRPFEGQEFWRTVVEDWKS